MHHLPSINPLFGLLAGLLHLVVGLALIAGLTLLVLTLLKKRDKAGFWGPAGHGGPWSPGPHGPDSPGGPGARSAKGGPPWRHRRGPRPPFEALGILDERFARSEIDVDDYLTRRAVLLGDRPNGTEYTPEDPAEPPPPAPPAPEPPAAAPADPPGFRESAPEKSGPPEPQEPGESVTPAPAAPDGESPDPDRLPPRVADWLTPDQEAESEPRRPTDEY